MVTRLELTQGNYRDVKGLVCLVAPLPSNYTHSFYVLMGGDNGYLSHKARKFGFKSKSPFPDQRFLDKQQDTVLNTFYSNDPEDFSSFKGDTFMLDSPYSGDIVSLRGLFFKVFNRYIGAFHMRNPPFAQVEIIRDENAEFQDIPGWNAPVLKYRPHLLPSSDHILSYLNEAARNNNASVSKLKILAGLDPREEDTEQIETYLDRLELSDRIVRFPPGKLFKHLSSFSLR